MVAKEDDPFLLGPGIFSGAFAVKFPGSIFFLNFLPLPTSEDLINLMSIFRTIDSIPVERFFALHCPGVNNLTSICFKWVGSTTN